MTINFEPLVVPRLDAFDLIGVKPTKGHALINDGELDARKVGKLTVITMASIKRYIASLPRIGGEKADPSLSEPIGSAGDDSGTGGPSRPRPIGKPRLRAEGPSAARS
jgi:hypothetical protein